MPNPLRFIVTPRYSAGSPAQVDEETAAQVASQEKECYLAALEGLYGDVAMLRAQTQGLNGIVETLQERRKGFDILDLITGQFRRREPIKAKELRVGDVIVGHTDAHSRHSVTRVRVGFDHVYVEEVTAKGFLQFRVDEKVMVERIVDKEI